MNQGIVVEVKRDYSITLSEGIYYKIHNKKAMTVGMEVLFTNEDIVAKRLALLTKGSVYRYASVAAVLVLVLMMSLVYYNNNLAVYAVVTMDINPSVEVLLNKNNKVIEISAMNNDGTKVLELLDTDTTGMPFEKALAYIVDEIKLGYSDVDNELLVMLTTVGLKGDVEERITSIEDIVVRAVLEEEVFNKVTVGLQEATEKELEQAKDEDKPLALVALQNEGKAANVTKVKELKEPNKLEEVAEEGLIIRNQFGNSYENRGDVFAFGARTDKTTGAAVEFDVDTELYSQYQEALIKLGDNDYGKEELKSYKEVTRELLKSMKVKEGEVDEEAEESEDKSSNGNNEDKSNNGKSVNNEKKDKDVDKTEIESDEDKDVDSEVENDVLEDANEEEDESKEEKTMKEKLNNGKNK